MPVTRGRAAIPWIRSFLRLRTVPRCWTEYSLSTVKNHNQDSSWLKAVLSTEFLFKLDLERPNMRFTPEVGSRSYEEALQRS